MIGAKARAALGPKDLMFLSGSHRGKVAIPAEILTKPGKVRPSEYELIKDADAGYEILCHIDFGWPVADIVRQHHERIDGSGYPHSLSGAAIVTAARVIAVANTVEAMTSNRPYRQGLGLDMALDEIRAGRAIRYDPDAVDACLQLFASGKSPWEHPDPRS